MSHKNDTESMIAAAALLTEKQEPFNIGDLVVLKHERFGTKHVPKVGQPVVVTRLTNGLVDGVKQAGSPYFNEPLDFAFLAEVMGGNYLIECHADSRRFRLATQEEIAAWDEWLQDIANSVNWREGDVVKFIAERGHFVTEGKEYIVGRDLIDKDGDLDIQADDEGEKNQRNSADKFEFVCRP